METDGVQALTSDSNPSPKVEVALCTGCGRCVAACKIRCITLETFGFRKSAVLLHPERCNLCGRCVNECPVHAITNDPS